MNVTASPIPPVEDGSSHAPEGFQKVAESILLLLVALVGMSGNALVVIAVALSKKLQSTGHIYVATLAVIDFLTALVQVFHAAVVVSGVGTVGLRGICAMVAALNVNLLGSSMSLLTLIAINRVQVITNNIPTSRQSSSWWKVAASIAALLTANTAIITTTAVLDNAKFELNSAICQHKGSYLELVIGMACFVYLTIIVICYVKVYLHVKRHFRKVAHIRSERSFVQSEQTGAPSTTISVVQLETNVDDNHTEVRTMPSVDAPENNSNETDVDNRPVEPNRKKGMSRESKVTLNMFLLVVSFIACIIPAMLFQLVPGESNYGWIGLVILTSNCCWNPVIYSWKHPDFKPIFRNIIRGRFSQIEEPTAWLRNRVYAERQERRSM